MRFSKSNDVWRELSKGGQKTAISNLILSYQERINGPVLSLVLDGPISLLCGENGVGKSTALKAIASALGGVNASVVHPPGDIRTPAVNGLSATLRVKKYDDALKVVSYSDELEQCQDIEGVASKLVSDDGSSIIYWYDPTLQIPYILHLLRNDANVSDLWSGVDAKKLNSDELSDISQIVGRVYSNVEIYEINDYGDHPVIPYFKATSNGVTYGSEEMGLGELSLLFIFWIIQQLPHAGVLLLEEPETFIAPQAQRALIDRVAAAALEKNLFVVASSHSPIITERIPPLKITYVGRQGAQVTFIKPAPRNILVDRLGIRSKSPLLLVVEDAAAAAFLRGLLVAGSSKYVGHFSIFIAGSDGEISNVLKMLRPASDPIVKIIGVFDGDQRKNMPKNLPWPVMCLPGDKPPELFSIDFIQSFVGELGDIFARDVDVARVAMASVGGMDHHDLIVSFCASMFITIDEYFYKIAEAYFATAPHARTFISEIEAKAAAVN